MTIKLTVNQVAILGRPRSACEENAKLLIKAGVYMDGPETEEYYQAVVIHWSWQLLRQYGNRWGEEATAMIKKLSKEFDLPTG